MADSDFSDQQKLDSICNDFEEQWSPEAYLKIPEYLSQVEVQLRDQLLRMLLDVDVELRKKAGSTLTPSDYSKLGESAVQHVEQLCYDDSEMTVMPGATPIELATTAPEQKSQNSATWIGPYKLLQQIGEGGMGSVWMAEQEKPVRRRVALKLIRGDMGSKEAIARFEAERQALAMMDHQNIAKVLDAGTTETGNPYFVMELVKGIPITQYCDENKLSIKERLELFVPVCNAIQHAHQKGIIHRDLKPSNVLVTLYDGKPVPKVIDFGLAKALEHTTRLTDKTMFTEFGKVVGTVQYMAPEQAEMNALDVDTRTDVYSLGVMLYELLTGSTPLDKDTLGKNALLQILAIIREKEPPRPSARLSSSGDAVTGISEQRKIAPAKLQQILRGELDWIVIKALEKDRTRRYETANGLAMDVDRYLNNDVVLARPPSASYRLRKQLRQIRNNPIAASFAGIVLTITVLIPIVFLLISNNNAAAKKREAAIQRKEEIDGLLKILTNVETDKVSKTIEELEPYWRDVKTQIEDLAISDSSEAKLHAQLVKERYGHADIEFLVQRMKSGSPIESRVVSHALQDKAEILGPNIWLDALATKNSVLGFAGYLATADPHNPNWSELSQQVVGELIEQDSSAFVVWANELRPVADHLVPELVKQFKTYNESDSVIAFRLAELISSYSQNPDVLVDVLAESKPKAFKLFLDSLKTQRDAAVNVLRSKLSEISKQQYGRENQTDVDDSMARLLSSYYGGLTADHAYCLTLPEEKLKSTVDELSKLGYRLQQLRPFASPVNAPRFACIWKKDGFERRFVTGLSKVEVIKLDQTNRKEGFSALDVAGYLAPAEGNSNEKYAAVWANKPDGGTFLVVGLDKDRWNAVWKENKDRIKRIQSFYVNYGKSHFELPRYSGVVSYKPGARVVYWNRTKQNVDQAGLYRDVTDIGFFNAEPDSQTLETVCRLSLEDQKISESDWKYGSIWTFGTLREYEKSDHRSFQGNREHKETAWS